MINCHVLLIDEINEGPKWTNVEITDNFPQSRFGVMVTSQNLRGVGPTETGRRTEDNYCDSSYEVSGRVMHDLFKMRDITVVFCR